MESLYDKHRILDAIGIGVIFLFFFQAVTLLIEAIYMKGLLGTGIDEHAVGIVFFLFAAFLYLFGLNKEKSSSHDWKLIHTKILHFSGLGMILFRLLAPLFDTVLCLVFSGISVGGFMIFFPLFLWHQSHSNYEQSSLKFGLGLTGTVLLSILFRSLNSTVDLTFYKTYQIIAWFIGIIAVFYVFNLTKSDEYATKPMKEPSKNKAPFMRVVGLILGIISIFLLIYIAFESPTVISRWTEGNYIVIVTLLSGSLSGFIILSVIKPEWLVFIHKKEYFMGWNLIFGITLLITILAHTIRFPPLPSSPAVTVTSPEWYQQIPLYLMVLSSPIIYFDFMLIIRQLIQLQPTIPQLATGFTLGGLHFILVVFIFVFTNIWGYVEPISQIFRNKFWFPFLIAILGIWLGLLCVKYGDLGIQKLKDLMVNHKIFKGKLRKTAMIGIVLISMTFLSTFTAVLISSPELWAAPQDLDNITSLTLMTYNIQNGVNEAGSKNYDQQLQVIIDSNADIIALQESDTAKLGGGNSDVVRYYAEKLGFYSYYGPKKVTGTYGTAILSRYPITAAETFFTYSDKDEIGTAYVQIEVGGRTFHIFNNHPAGSHDAFLAHIETLMDRIEGLDNVISMGDFNFRQGSIYYNKSVDVLVDTWLAVYPDGTGNGLDMTRRIDHIFVSPEFTITGSTYIPPPESYTDHPVYWTNIHF